MTEGSPDDALRLPAGQGRRYAMGRLTAVFKADGAETGNRYSASEWCLDPGQPGVGAHRHDANDEIFLVLDGCPEFLVEGNWTVCPAGTFLRIPAGVTNDFRNAGPAPARFFSMFLGDGFERNMPDIVAWFAARAPQTDSPAGQEPHA
jgi:quercetin dioxygenase-like cupin family protein